MPAFTFEKISSPIRSNTKAISISGNSGQDSAKQSRNFIVNMLDRFAVARMKREMSDADTSPPLKRPPPD